MFLNLMAISGIGLLMKYTLVPGFRRNEIYGRNVELNLFGLDRHEWGSIHLILSFLFIGLLILHIILHWKLIICLFKRYFRKKVFQYFTASVLTVSAIILIFSPFFIKPTVLSSKEHVYKHQKNIHDTESDLLETDTFRSPQKLRAKKLPIPQMHSEHHQNHKIYPIYGYMTLQEVAQKYDIPVNYLMEQLRIQESESIKRKLGQLKKRYDFNMNEVSQAIENYINE